MRQWFAILALMLSAGAARAEGCPEFYRFVDFGLRDLGGELHRGGPVLRAEDFEGRSLLLSARTQCLAVREVSRDGRGNPIPVVRHVEYDPEKTGLGLETLSVGAVDDLFAQAEQWAQAHRARMARPGAKIARGQRFLCARDTDEGMTSCQLVSPYKGKAALTVTCDAALCEMPVLAINARLVISASWAAGEGVLEADAEKILSRVRAIHGFLAPLSSGV